MLRPTVHFAGVIVIVLVGTFCSFAASGPLKGKIKKGIYESPAGNFTIPVPKGHGDWSGFVGVHINEGYAPDGTMGVVSFADDFGKLLGVAYLRAHEKSLPLIGDTTRTYGLLEEWIRQFALPTFFYPASAASRVARVEEIRFAGAPAALALVDIPGGRTLKAVTAGKEHALDSRRGLLVFARDGYVYMLYDETLREDEAFADSAGALALDLDALVRSKLEPFYATIRFSALPRRRRRVPGVTGGRRDVPKLITRDLPAVLGRSD